MPSTGSRVLAVPRTGVRSPPAAGTGLAPALLATLAYHDLLNLPLTAVECWRYLLRPRSSVLNPYFPSLSEVEQALGGLVAAGSIETHHGFFSFPGRAHLVAERIEKHARSQGKWRRLRRIVRWLQLIPFLRGVAVTGSLAFENAKPSSDLDVLIVAAPNRVWTVRFLLTILLDLCGLRRRPQGETRDRVCLNHYVSEGMLDFPFRSLYTAMEYARFVPLLGEGVCRDLRAANRAWVEEYLVRVFPETLSHQKTLRPSRTLRAAQRAGELALSWGIGDQLERILAAVQRARIARVDTAPLSDRFRPGRVIATEAHAEFHPRSREAPLLTAFNDRMSALGLADLFGHQRDSGLTLSGT